VADPTRGLRADARRNRAKVLAVAAEVFASEGLSVPVHEIARRAGVGTGTVSRHFPTKESLFAAVLLDRMAWLAGRAGELAGTADPGEAFRTYFRLLLGEAAAHRGLAEALAGTGYDVEAAGAEAGHDPSGALRDLLAEAQRAGAIRADVTYPDVKALLNGCLTGEGGGADRDRLAEVVVRGLRPDLP
jgi:AcrR family transcriptional regulator